jgi:hypothetical protein
VQGHPSRQRLNPKVSRNRCAWPFATLAKATSRYQETAGPRALPMVTNALAHRRERTRWRDNLPPSRWRTRCLLTSACIGYIRLDGRSVCTLHQYRTSLSRLTVRPSPNITRAAGINWTHTRLGFGNVHAGINSCMKGLGGSDQLLERLKIERPARDSERSICAGSMLGGIGVSPPNPQDVSISCLC